MCGISGILLNKGTVQRKALTKNNNCMKHRGPDSSGAWISEDKKSAFSQTRLSIVDLDERASQPMILEDVGYVLVFNGEIYNYKTLRDKLAGKYTFRTTSDTEVLGYAFKEYGINIFEHLEGMFVFAIYDKKTKETILARDFVGQKPLVYYEGKEGFYFASEIPVLLSTSPCKKDIDMASLGVFMTDNFAHIPQPFSAFKEIRKLRPGHYLIVKNGKIVSEKKYFKFTKNKQGNESEYEFISRIVEEMKPTDVTYSSFLSGGNDSSLVCACLRRHNTKRVEAYTLRLGKNDSDYTRSLEAAKLLNLHHHSIDFDPKSFLSSVEEHVRIYGEPYYHLTSVYADSILKEVRKKHKVIFTGAGGDEVYYGYNNRDLLAAGFFLKVRKAIPKPVLRFIFGRKYEFLYDSNLRDVKVKYYLHSYAKTNKIFSENINPLGHFDTINRDFFEFAEINNFVDLSYMSGLVTENSHSLTIQGDLSGMKNSVEIRCPFLERRIIQRGFSLPLYKKISIWNPKEGKMALKKALMKVFPRRLVYARKIGFGVEISKQRAIIDANHGRILSKLKKLSLRDGFNSGQVMSFAENKDVIEKNFTRIMKLYALEIWFEEFID